MCLSVFTLADCAGRVLGLKPMAQQTIVAAESLRCAHCPSFPVDFPAFIIGINTPQLLETVRAALLVLYPSEHVVSWVHGIEENKPASEQMTLNSLTQADTLGLNSVLYLPPLEIGASLESFYEIVAHLRAPDGCPWDRKQTHSSLRPYLLEETYEAIAALDENDPQKIKEEFGDIVLQVALHAQIASEAGTFNLADVLQNVYRKIVHRHPHVFGDVQVDSISGVLVNWEKLKAEERVANGQFEKGMLDSVPVALPALSLAQEYQSRAARVGFDWHEVEPVVAKVLEELEEVRTAPDADSRAKELGDLLFAVVNLVRWYKVDAESTLRETNQRFRRRFQHVERRTREIGRQMLDMTLDEMDVFWEEAKQQE